MNSVSRLRVLLILAVVASLALSVPAVASEDTVEENRTVVDSESTDVLVYLNEYPREANSRVQLQGYSNRSQGKLLDYIESNENLRLLNKFWITNAVLVEVGTEFNKTNLEQLDGVRGLTTNTQVELLDASPNTSTSYYDSSSGKYGINQINAPEVWSRYSTRGEGVKVAVLDTGVNVTHPDLSLRSTDPTDPTYPGGWAEFDRQGNQVSSEPHDADGHGTHVSGIVAGENTGVAPRADLMHGMILRGSRGNIAQALSGIEWAVENDADVITMSIGTDTTDIWLDAIENANRMGTVVISSVGNSGRGTSTSPGNVYGTISVGSTDQSVSVPQFSSGEILDYNNVWGVDAPDDVPDEYVVPDVVAAGVGINSTSLEGGYATYTGTSMSSPHVAGAVALMMSASSQDLSLKRTRNALRLTAYGSGTSQPNTRYGFGSVDALSATDFVTDEARLSISITDNSGRYVDDADLRINNSYIGKGADHSVELSAGNWLIEVSAPGYIDATETVNLSSGEDREAMVVVREPSANFSVNNLSAPSEAEPGVNISIGARITNTGGVTGSQDIEVRFNTGSLDPTHVIKTRTDVELQPTESAQHNFTIDLPDSEGSYRYGIFTDNTSQTSNITLRTHNLSGTYRISNLVAPREVEVSNEFMVNATITNTRNTESLRAAELRLNHSGASLTSSSTVAEKNVNLNQSDSTNISFVADAPDRAGDYDYGIFIGNSSVQSNLTVRETDAVDRYRNNGSVDTAGLQDAINDFIAGDINTGGLQEVINAFILD